MQLVLDTCAVLAYFGRERMRRQAIEAIDRARAMTMALLPSVSALEIAQKCAAGKLSLVDGLSPRAFFERVGGQAGMREVPISTEVAISAYELPEPFHRDPADRLVVAMARLLDVPIVTNDRQILAYGRLGHVRTIDY